VLAGRRENESFNVAKNHGYHLEHNFGHGKQHRAQQFVLLNLLAFAFHAVCDSVEKLWKQGRAVLGTRTGIALPADFPDSCREIPRTSQA
jgi:hypothetical protein